MATGDWPWLRSGAALLHGGARPAICGAVRQRVQVSLRSEAGTVSISDGFCNAKLG